MNTTIVWTTFGTMWTYIHESEDVGWDKKREKNNFF